MTDRPHWLLHESLLESGERYGGKTALVVDGDPYPYAELFESSLRLARGLQDLGLERGDRVVIHMENSWPCVLTIFATLLGGGVFVLVNAQTKGEKLAYIIGDSEAAFLLTEGHLARMLPGAAEGLPSLHAVICADPPADAPSLVDLGELVRRSDPAPRSVVTIPLDLASLIYTSGTTGSPKGVMMTHRSMVFAVESVCSYLRLTGDERILNVFPLSFSYGLYQLLLAVRLGATLVLERSFAFPAQTLRRIAEHGVTVFPGVPTIFATLLSLKEPPVSPTVTRVTNAGAALPPEFVPGVEQLFPNARLFLMYGQTECKRVCYLDPELVRTKPASVGKAMPGTEAFVLLADGRPAAPGEVGVLHVRGPHVMAGYWRQPELTATVLREGPVPGERMLCTHDLFRTDEDGDLFFVARSDDIINTRGEKVSPVEVEHVLYAIPGIREAAVLGVPDDVLGEEVCAFVVLDPGVSLTEQEIRHACRARLENVMVPTRIEFLAELPKTTTGKIQKRELMVAER